MAIVELARTLPYYMRKRPKPWMAINLIEQLILQVVRVCNVGHVSIMGSSWGHQVKADTRRRKNKAEFFQLFPSFQWINSEAVELTGERRRRGSFDVQPLGYY